MGQDNKPGNNNMFKNTKFNNQIDLGEVIQIIGLILSVLIAGLTVYYGLWVFINDNKIMIIKNQHAAAENRNMISGLAEDIKQQSQVNLTHYKDISNRMNRGFDRLENHLIRVEKKVEKKQDK